MKANYIVHYTIEGHYHINEKFTVSASGFSEAAKMVIDSASGKYKRIPIKIEFESTTEYRGLDFTPKFIG